MAHSTLWGGSARERLGEVASERVVGAGRVAGDLLDVIRREVAEALAKRLVVIVVGIGVPLRHRNRCAAPTVYYGSIRPINVS